MFILPFSFALSILGSLLENITKTAKILLDMPVGIMLSKIKGEDIKEAKKCYLSDFVHMVYPVKNKSEHHVSTQKEYTMVTNNVVN